MAKAVWQCPSTHTISFCKAHQIKGSLFSDSSSCSIIEKNHGRQTRQGNWRTEKWKPRLALAKQSSFGTQTKLYKGCVYICLHPSVLFLSKNCVKTASCHSPVLVCRLVADNFIVHPMEKCKSARLTPFSSHSLMRKCGTSCF